MSILRRATPLVRTRECAALLLKLLQHCCKIRSNRRRMLTMGGTRQLLAMLPEAFASAALGAVAERLALTIESLLEEELSEEELSEEELSGAPLASEPPDQSGVAAMDLDSAALPHAGAHAGAAAAGEQVAEPMDGAAPTAGAPPSDDVAVAVAGLQSPAARDNTPLVRAITRLLPL
eukprot:7260397-Prymnesium_polylepis.1